MYTSTVVVVQTSKHTQLMFLLYTIPGSTMVSLDTHLMSHPGHTYADHTCRSLGTLYANGESLMDVARDRIQSLAVGVSKLCRISQRPIIGILLIRVGMQSTRMSQDTENHLLVLLYIAIIKHGTVHAHTHTLPWCGVRSMTTMCVMLYIYIYVYSVYIGV